VSISKVLQGCIILCQGRFLLLKLSSEKDPVVSLLTIANSHHSKSRQKKGGLNMELEKFIEMESESSKDLMF